MQLVERGCVGCFLPDLIFGCVALHTSFAAQHPIGAAGFAASRFLLPFFADCATVLTVPVVTAGRSKMMDNQRDAVFILKNLSWA